MTDALISLIQDILSPLQWSLNWINVLEIGFIVVILFVFYQKFIKDTQSEKLVKGLFILIFAWILSEILILIDLRILGVFLKSLVTLYPLSVLYVKLSPITPNYSDLTSDKRLYSQLLFRFFKIVIYYI